MPCGLDYKQLCSDLDKKPRQKTKVYKNKDVFANCKNPNKIISKVKQKLVPPIHG
jgi:hypothetical protein